MIHELDGIGMPDEPDFSIPKERCPWCNLDVNQCDCPRNQVTDEDLEQFSRDYLDNEAANGNIKADLSSEDGLHPEERTSDNDNTDSSLE
jgi:hypothetical protein